MEKVYILVPQQEIELIKDWKFTLDESLYNKFRQKYVTSRKIKNHCKIVNSFGYNEKSAIPIQVILEAGTKLRVSKMKLVNGSHETITFLCTESPCGKLSGNGRFTVPIKVANKIYCCCESNKEEDSD